MVTRVVVAYLMLKLVIFRLSIYTMAGSNKLQFHGGPLLQFIVKQNFYYINYCYHLLYYLPSVPHHFLVVCEGANKVPGTIRDPLKETVVGVVSPCLASFVSWSDSDQGHVCIHGLAYDVSSNRDFASQALLGGELAVPLSRAGVEQDLGQDFTM